MPSELRLKELKPLFFSPLAVFEVEQAAALNRQLLEEVALRRADSAGVRRSNWHGWHSEDDLFQRKEPGCRALCAHILRAIQTCTTAVSPGFDFARHAAHAEGWINVLGRGGLNTPHDHPAWTWSGTYYVHVPEAEASLSGNIEFLDGRTNLRALNVDGAACFASKFTLKPQAGTLLVFPAYLRHWVYPNESDEERTSVAFNARFTPL